MTLMFCVDLKNLSKVKMSHAAVTTFAPPLKPLPTQPTEYQLTLIPSDLISFPMPYQPPPPYQPHPSLDVKPSRTGTKCFVVCLVICLSTLISVVTLCNLK